MNEKIYKTMKRVGSWNIVFGVIMITLGLAIGIIQIVHGGKLLVHKRDITF